jgi:L-talarate/galactarate dehydratase
LSAIDIALWDIRGKALNLPLWKLLGGARQRVATYASGALRRNLSLDQVVTAAGKLKEKGFREMKTQLALPGDTSPAKEVERMRRVREAIGPDIKLMCDINQRWRPEQAIDIGKRVEDAGVGLFWLEDVTDHDDYAGIARVNAALSTPICGGELVWGIVPFRHMIEARSVDYVMIDLARVGGITQWLKVAGMAEAFNLPVVSHVIPEIHSHLVAAAPNGLTVEYMGWMLKLFDGVAEFDPGSGELALSDRAGLGLEFSQATIDRYAA